MPRRSDRLSAGARDRVITIEQRPVEDTADADSGEPVDGPWTTLVANMSAAREEYRGYERQRSDQTVARYDVKWDINYRADMDPELIDVPKLRRLVVEGRRYDIVSAEQVGRRRGVCLYVVGRG